LRTEDGGGINAEDEVSASFFAFYVEHHRRSGYIDVVLISIMVYELMHSQM
jgi:hypothetical protein